MEMYEYPRHMRKIIEYSELFWQRKEIEKNPTAEYVEHINSKDVDRRTLRILPKYPKKEIVISSFIIPVQDGAVTGYYFSNPRMTAFGLSPLIVYFHGGGWMYGNMDFYGHVLAHLAHATGASILSVDYRLAPKYKFPTAVEDCYDALLWAAEGAKYWKIDPDRIFIAGDSAGGNLAAVVAQLVRDRKGPQLAGQILICPITDGRLRTLSIEEHAVSPTLSTKMLQFYINNYIREPKDILSPMFSPLLSPDKSRLAPALIITAEDDPLKDDGKLYQEALESGGSEAKVFTAKNTFHGFLLYRNATGSQEATCAIRQFVSGRPLKNVQFMTESDLRRENRMHHAELSSGEES